MSEILASKLIRILQKIPVASQPAQKLAVEALLAKYRSA